MNEIVSAALARLLAEIPAVPVPAETDLAYGRDLACVADCYDDFRTLDPRDPRVVLYAIARRFMTPRGTLLDDPGYGFDLRGLLHKPLTQKNIRLMQVQATGEAEKDLRVDTVTLRLDFADSRLHVRLHVVPRDPSIAPFAGVMLVTQKLVEVVE